MLSLLYVNHKMMNAYTAVQLKMFAVITSSCWNQSIDQEMFNVA